MPEEVVGIIVIALAAFTAISITLMVNVRRYLENKNGLRGGSGSSITTSELETLIEEAAEDATRPLLKRIENLEAVIAETDGGQDLLADSDTYFESSKDKDGVRIVSRGTRQ